MKSFINNGVKIIATGFIVLVLLSLPLFWGRLLSEARIGMMIPDKCSYVSIKPSGLVPPELENDSKVVYHSQVSASIGPKGVILGLGIVDYFISRLPARLPEAHPSHIYYYDKDDKAWMYFDEKLGLILCYYTYREGMPDKTLLRKKVRLYAGPEGVSESPDKAVGRFIFPIVDARATPMPPLTLYDKKLHRFFTISFKERTVTKGPELGKDDIHKPVQIGLLWKLGSFLHLDWEAPRVKVAEKEERDRYYVPGQFKPIVGRNYTEDAGQYLLVLDRSGRIDLLDRKTLEFAGIAAWLPAPETLFPSKQRVTPEDLLAYDVLPLSLRTDNKYRGMFVATASREGTSLALAVFDQEGKLIKSDYTESKEYAEYRRTVTVPSSKAALFEAPWAPMMTITKYLLENLHPPILSLVSYFTAYNFEAGAGHRALFLLPNSFIAMKGRDVSQNAGSRLGFALLLVLPSLILGIFLAWRVEKDAILFGLSENARLCWMIGTIAFGLAGYITYRLTRPKETLVTCVNCGRLRRPDMDRCHRCGSKWQIPELMPPTWRVTDT
jgi:hypothetical protein